MSRVLLLNASWEPLRTLSWKRAVLLVLEDKAEVIELEESREVRSASHTLGMPSVIRLKYFVKVPYRARLPLSRRAILARDDYECQFTHCQRRGTTVDHVIPRSRGGAHGWTNVVAACPRCNTKKADKTLEQLGWTLKTQPFIPRGTRWLVVGVKQQEAWQPYLTEWSST